MNVSEQPPWRRLAGCLVGCGLAVLWFVQAANMQAQHRRLDANPHSTGLIERTWVQYGKSGGRFADLSFTSHGEDGTLACRAKAVRIGPTSIAASARQTIDLAPRPGDCSPPDIPTARSPDFAVWLLYLGSFLAGTVSLLKLTGAPPTSARIWT